ncbi:MAG: hypothetical protein MI974_16215 [Chitinophagales bacterium]|nr:hypothetical protein [Chitinophagales bacterium]
MNYIVVVKENKIQRVIINSILLALFWLASLADGNAQSYTPIEGKSIMSLRYEKPYQKANSLKTKVFTRSLLTPFPVEENDFDSFTKTLTVPSAYKYDELGIFCKWEVQMEKAAKIPVKFRLGEVQYVERMEGKLK